MDLKNNAYKPFIKPNTNTKYVSTQSNHPPAIIANIPDAICKRLSSVSSSKEMFEEMQIQEDTELVGSRKKRTRAVIWYNPPYSNNVRTNLGRKFLTLLRKHFPSSSELYKLFNPKKVKLSYSCCPSMKAIISSHNAKVTRAKECEEAAGCNCRGGVSVCPLQGRCQVQSLVYKATVSSGDGERSYIGQAASTFKLRFNNHTNSFINPAKKHSTALSTYVWNLNRREMQHNIRWSIESEPKPYTGGGRTCDLCIIEKTMIARSKTEESLNRRTEIMAKCRHRLPFFLNNYHGLQLSPVPYQPELPPVPEQPDLDPPDLELLLLPSDAYSEGTGGQHEDDTDNLLQPQPPVSGPVTRSRSRKQKQS